MGLIDLSNDAISIISFITAVIAVFPYIFKIKKYINRHYFKKFLSVKGDTCAIVIPTIVNDRPQNNQIYLYDVKSANVLSDIFISINLNMSVKVLGTYDTNVINRCHTQVLIGRPVYHPQIAFILQTVFPDFCYFHPHADKYPIRTSSTEVNAKEGFKYGKEEKDVIWVETTISSEVSSLHYRSGWRKQTNNEISDPQLNSYTVRGYVLIAKLTKGDIDNDDKSTLLILPCGRNAGLIFMDWLSEHYQSIAKKTKGKHFCYLYPTDHRANLVIEKEMVDLSYVINNIK